ncbi:MAG: hypothetical protein ACR9NN_16280 [Nostochopsis sp.]
MVNNNQQPPTTNIYKKGWLKTLEKQSHSDEFRTLGYPRVFRPGSVNETS